MARHIERKFTEQRKADAVRLVTSGSEPITEVTAQFGLTESVLGEWMKHVEVDVGRGLPGALTTAARAELIDL